MTSYKDSARKAVYRAVRYNRAVEWLQAKLRRTSTISFDAIGLSVTLKPGNIVIDCGANVGDVASRLARSGATIYAFEPQPDCFAIVATQICMDLQGSLLQSGRARPRLPDSSPRPRSPTPNSMRSIRQWRLRFTTRSEGSRPRPTSNVSISAPSSID